MDKIIIADMYGSKMIEQLFWILFMNGIEYHLHEFGLDARKPVFRVCEQQKHRPACSSVQTDQHLC